jgi:hypothetical protein
VRGNAATSLADLSQGQLKDQLTRAGVVSAVGDAQQGHDQAALDAAYQEFVRHQQLQLAAAGAWHAGAGRGPVGQTTNTKGTTQVDRPGRYARHAGQPGRHCSRALYRRRFAGRPLGRQALSTTSPATQSLWKDLL